MGDYLAFQVDKTLAGVAQINGKPYVSNDVVWDNGLFPNRIAIKFLNVSLPENRLPILGEIREALISVWGTNYGWGILNQVVLAEIESKKIVDSIKVAKNDLNEVQRNIDTFLIEAKVQREAISRKKVRKHSNKGEVESLPFQELPPQETISPKEASLHSKAQHLLIRLGLITKCSTWIASNDRNSNYMGKDLAAVCLNTLPNIGLSDEALKRIKLIDVIWLRQNAPLCAFEVEVTTSIYSGLLRLSDLVSVVPAINIKLFIVAPNERKAKVLSELSRPTFQKIGLSDYCRFISIEELETLVSNVKDLSGHVQATIVDTIAKGLESDCEGGLG
jgi:hypothetical protein